MLYQMPYAEQDIDFQIYLDAVTKLYWPKAIFSAEDHVKDLPGRFEKKESNDKRLESIKEALKKIAKSVENEKLYSLYATDDRPAEQYLFPFAVKFHEYFFTRKWDEPFDDPQKHPYEYFHLHPPVYRNQDEPNWSEGKNYSKNVGDYHHFVNVVAALARLIMYFKDPRNVMDIFEFKHKDNIAREEELDTLCNTVAYEKEPSMRTFNLMLAGLYHDIGKTITGPRHGMEGYTILAFHTSKARYQINQIVSNYSEKYSFHRDDLLYVADLVFYHDQFGTISTGEDSYLRLEEVISAIKNYCGKYVNEREKWQQRYLFDLWVLNVADIIASLNDKYIFQKVWLDSNESSQRIRDFFRGDTTMAESKTPGAYLAYDVSTLFDIMKGSCQGENADEPTTLQTSLYPYSLSHTVERIRRLIKSSLQGPLKNILDHSSDEKYIGYMKKVASFTKQLSDRDWDTSIIRSIHSIGDFQEFCRRLSWIGKMDYALGFFQKIATRILDRINDEICKEGPRTGWLRDPDAPLGDGNDEINYRYKVQAQFIADNYAATIVQILSYLLFREKQIDGIRNIEFNDARERLNNDKIDKIVTLDGPFRARRATQLILQTVYVY